MSKLLAQATNVFGDRGLQPSDLPFQISGSDSTQAQAQSLTNLELIISQLLGALTVTGSIFFILYFVIAAYKWLSAGGDSGKVQKARDQITNGVLGLIVLVAGYAVIGLIGRVVGLNILQPAAVIRTLIPTTP